MIGSGVPVEHLSHDFGNLDQKLPDFLMGKTVEIFRGIRDIEEQVYSALMMVHDFIPALRNLATDGTNVQPASYRVTAPASLATVA